MATKFKRCVNNLRSVQRLILMAMISSFRSISTNSALVLANSVPIEKRALQLAAIATLKNYKPGNNLVNQLFRDTNIDPTIIDPPCVSHLMQIPPYVQSQLSIYVCKPNSPPQSLLLDQPNHYFLYTDGSKTKEATSYAAILTDP